MNMINKNPVAIIAFFIKSVWLLINTLKLPHNLLIKTQRCVIFYIPLTDIEAIRLALLI